MSSKTASLLGGKSAVQTMIVLARKELEQMQAMLRQVRQVRMSCIGNLDHVRACAQVAAQTIESAVMPRQVDHGISPLHDRCSVSVSCLIMAHEHMPVQMRRGSEHHGITLDPEITDRLACS